MIPNWQWTVTFQNCDSRATSIFDELDNLDLIWQLSAHRFVFSFITSRLDYCNSLFAGISEKQSGRLQQVQNNAARLVTKTRMRDHITPVLKELHWLPVKYRAQFKIATIAHQCLYDTEYPEYLTELVPRYTPARSLRSGHRTLVVTPRTKLKTFGERALPSQAALVWNHLPAEIQNIPSLKLFKKQLKTHLFKKHFN